MQIISANNLVDGLVVYLTPVGWVSDIARAQLLADSDATAAGLARAARDVDANIVVEPYEIDITVEGGSPIPVRFRERIRVSGPTTGSTHLANVPVPATAHAA